MCVEAVHKIIRYRYLILSRRRGVGGVGRGQRRPSPLERLAASAVVAGWQIGLRSGFGLKLGKGRPAFERLAGSSTCHAMPSQSCAQNCVSEK